MTATTDDPRTDDIDELEGDDFDDPAVDQAEQTMPVDRRERTTRIVAALAVAAACGLFAARVMGWGPFGSDPDPADNASSGPAVQVVLPQKVIDAIEAAHQPGRLTEFENRPSAQDPSACQTLPPFTNEALYGLAAGDSVALCERVLESGADPCTLWIGVATTDKGAIFYLSSSGQPLPNQANSVPTKVAVCPPAAPTTTTAVPPATTVPAAPAQQPGA